MTFLGAFLVTFVAGPAAFWVLARQEPTRSRFLGLWAGTIGLVGLAVALRVWVLPGWPVAGLPIVMALWLGWIAVLALAVLAVRTRGVSPRYNRFAFALGAVATTLPWFGLYAAQMMASR